MSLLYHGIKVLSQRVAYLWHCLLAGRGVTREEIGSMESRTDQPKPSHSLNVEPVAIKIRLRMRITYQKRETSEAVRGNQAR